MGNTCTGMHRNVRRRRSERSSHPGVASAPTPQVEGPPSQVSGLGPGAGPAAPPDDSQADLPPSSGVPASPFALDYSARIRHRDAAHAAFSAKARVTLDAKEEAYVEHASKSNTVVELDAQARALLKEHPYVPVPEQDASDGEDEEEEEEDASGALDSEGRSLKKSRYEFARGATRISEFAKSDRGALFSLVRVGYFKEILEDKTNGARFSLPRRLGSLSFFLPLLGLYSRDDAYDLIICFLTLHYADVDPSKVARYDLDARAQSALHSLMYSTNRSDAVTKKLVDLGACECIVGMVRHAEPDSWRAHDKSQNNSDPWPSLAFDVATNLSKWPSARATLLRLGFLEDLYNLSKLRDTYWAFESMEGLAYLIADGQGVTETKYLEVEPQPVAKCLELLQMGLTGSMPYYGMEFGTFGRVLALRRLVQHSEANRQLILPKIDVVLEHAVGTLDFTTRIMCVLCLRDLVGEDESKIRALREAAEKITEREPMGSSTVFNQFANVEDELGRPYGAELALMLQVSGKDTVDVRDVWGRSMLMYAVQSSLSATKMLLEKGADVRAEDTSGFSVFCYAVYGSNREALDVVRRAVAPRPTQASLTAWLPHARAPRVVQYFVALGAEYQLEYTDEPEGDEVKLRAIREGIKERYAKSILMASHPRVGACAEPHHWRRLDGFIFQKILTFLAGELRGPPTFKVIGDSLDDGSQDGMF